MIQLFPPTSDIDLPSPTGPAGDGTSPTMSSHQPDEAAAVMAAVGAESREPGGDRPWLYTNMIVAADGATAIGGLSGELGGAGDRMMFQALRGQADIILVGAETARAERYRPPRAYASAQATRAERGQRPRPRLALVSRSLDLDPDLALFDDRDLDTRPFVISSRQALATRGEVLEGRVEAVEAGDDDVDLAIAVQELRKRGYERVLCEGGPSINGQLVASDLIDEWNLTIAPLLVGGDSKRAAVGPLPGGPPPGMRLSRVWEHDSHLFCRWVRDTGETGAE